MMNPDNENTQQSHTLRAMMRHLGSTQRVIHASGSSELASSDPDPIDPVVMEDAELLLDIPPANRLIRASGNYSHPVSYFNWAYSRNDGWRSDCNCDDGNCSTTGRGDSIISFSFDLSANDYEMRFWLRHYGLDYYASNGRRGDALWDFFANAAVAYRVFQGDWIREGQTSGGKFTNGNNQTAGGRLRGTIGVEIRRGTYLSRWLVEPEMGNRGREWKHCGHRFGISLTSQSSLAQVDSLTQIAADLSEEKESMESADS